MQERKNHIISTKKYNLQVSYFLIKKQIELSFVSKQSNYPFFMYTAKVPDVDERIFWDEMRKYRKIQLNLKTLSITLPNKNDSFKLEKKFFSDFQTKLNEIVGKKKNNYRIKYLSRKYENTNLDAVFDLHHSRVFITILESSKKIMKTAETTVSLSLLKGKSSPFKEKLPEDQLAFAFFKALSQSTIFNIFWQENNLETNNQLLNPIKLSSTLFIWKEDLKISVASVSEKVRLFRHIFLTELVTHMITIQFGRKKYKTGRYREGNHPKEYLDEELEELRSFGLRFSEFRDHPFQRKKLKNQCPKKKKIQLNQQKEESEDNYEDDDEDQYYGEASIPDSDSSDEEERIQQKEGNNAVKEEKKTKLGKMKEIIQNAKGICNFTLISGKDKSNINNIRYCLHQMTQETDKTQALMDFIRLVFKIYPKQELVRDKRDANKQKMAQFLDQFRTKLRVWSCLKEYTRESFFHKILNTGLRVLKHPYHLVYLRLPFSHIFWSIKRLYHRHKRVILKEKNQESKKVFTLYRGFQMDQKELKRIRKNINGYIEMEGFLSTTLKEFIADAFLTNSKMIIQVPVANLGGMYDNGFANISLYSEHPHEKEVLVNAFNIFKVLSLSSTLEENEMVVHYIRLQYGSIKQVEKKVGKSEKLLDAEFFYYENCKEFRRAVEALEKELIVNAKHQQYQLTFLSNYGELLHLLGEYRRMIIYSSRRIKQVQLDRAVEGYRWRNCQFVIDKEKNTDSIVFISEQAQRQFPTWFQTAGLVSFCQHEQIALVLLQITLLFVCCLRYGINLHKLSILNKNLQKFSEKTNFIIHFNIRESCSFRKDKKKKKK